MKRLGLRGWVAAGLIALLAGCGGGGSSPTATNGSGGASPGAVQSVTPRTAMGVLVPVYGYPTVKSSGVVSPNPQWTGVAALAASVPTVAIINPNNGPVACSSTATVALFQSGIASLQKAGVTVLGYIATGYGNVAASTVTQQLQTYADCYGVDGVFFDEVPTASSAAAYYAAIAQSARQIIRPPSGKTARVAINPGAYPALPVAQTADITVVHESADLNTPAAPASLASYPPAKFAYLAYNVSGYDAPTLQTLFNQGVGYVYLTDKSGDPWVALSSQYPQLVQGVAQINAAASAAN